MKPAVEEKAIESGFRPMRLLAGVLTVFLAIPLAANWYARNVSMPRYCDNPQEALHYLRKVITEPEPAGDEKRRPYLVASKLVFLIPQEAAEPLEDYLQRVAIRIQEHCRSTTQEKI